MAKLVLVGEDRFGGLVAVDPRNGDLYRASPNTTGLGEGELWERIANIGMGITDKILSYKLQSKQLNAYNAYSQGGANINIDPNRGASGSIDMQTMLLIGLGGLAVVMLMKR